MAWLAWLILFVVLVGILALQIFLSFRASGLYGLILPGFFLVYALTMVLNLATIPGATAAQSVRYSVLTFLTANVPTLILLIIYFVCRERKRRKKDLKK